MGEEGKLVRGAVLSSFATAETKEQKKVKIVVPPEGPHDARISIEDLVYTDADESDMYIHQSKENEKKAKQPKNGTQEPKKKTARDRDPRTFDENKTGKGPKNP